jgi:hypothetical protein
MKPILYIALLLSVVALGCTTTIDDYPDNVVIEDDTPESTNVIIDDNDPDVVIEDRTPDTIIEERTVVEDSDPDVVINNPSASGGSPIGGNGTD